MKRTTICKVSALCISALLMFSIAGCNLFGNDNENTDPDSNNTEVELGAIEATDFVANEELKFTTNKNITTANPYDLVYSAVDNDNNCYYFFDLGTIKNVPVDDGENKSFRLSAHMNTEYTFETTKVTSTSIEKQSSWIRERLVYEDKLASESGSAEFGVGVKELFELKLAASGSRQYYSNTNTTTNSDGIVETVEETVTESQTIKVTFDMESPLGDYRISNVMDYTVFVVVIEDANGDLTHYYMPMAQSGIYIRYEYSDDGFTKSLDFEDLSFDCSIVKSLEKPTEHIEFEQVEDSDDIVNKSEYSITLDVAGGNNLSQSTISVKKNEYYKLPVPVRYQYVFVGWYSSPNGNGVCYTDYLGNSNDIWLDLQDIILYAYWVLPSTQIDLDRLELKSQELYSQKTNLFSFNLNTEALNAAGYTALNISISGFCSGYDYRLNDRTRHFILTDSSGNTVLTWDFVVDGFSGVSGKNISLENLNSNELYQLQLVSDQSNAYDEKLIVSSLLMTVKAVK